MATGDEPPTEDAVTANDVEVAERQVAEARERAALAGFSAAQSFEDSARRHEQLARVQDRAVRQGASDTEPHRESAIRHRKAAADDRELAQLKRQESQADLAIDSE